MYLYTFVRGDNYVDSGTRGHMCARRMCRRLGSVAGGQRMLLSLSERTELKYRRARLGRERHAWRGAPSEKVVGVRSVGERMRTRGWGGRSARLGQVGLPYLCHVTGWAPPLPPLPVSPYLPYLCHVTGWAPPLPPLPMSRDRVGPFPTSLTCVT